MIAWTQKYVINKWFFLILLAVVIVAFVLTITPAGSGLTRTGEVIRRRDFFGINLASRKEVRPVIATATASAWLNTGQRNFIQSRLQDLPLTRAAYLHFADEISVPLPSDKELQEYIRSKRVFAGEDGSFSEEAYAGFRKLVDEDPEITQELMMQALTEDIRVDKLSAALSGPGYALPFEAKKQVENSKTVWSVNVANYKYEQFEPEIEIDEAEITSYYESNMAQFEEGAKVRVSLVKFDAERFADQATPTPRELLEYYESNKEQFNKEPPSTVEEDQSDPAPVTFESVEERVRKVVIAKKTIRLAAEAADAFVYRLFDEKIGRESKDKIAGLLDKAGVDLVELPAYSRSDPPNDTEVPRRSLEEAFALTDRRYYSDVIQTRNGAAVLLLDGIEDSRIPSLEEVRRRVEVLYRANEKKRLFTETGTELKGEFESAIGEGKSFRETAEAAGLEIETFEDFTSRNPPSEFDRRLFTQNSYLEVGQISPMVILTEDGKFVHILSKTLPEEDSNLSDLGDREDALERVNSYYQATNLIGEIVGREQKKSEVE